jgi:hypothetical protein
MGFSAFSVVLRLVIERTSFCVKRGKILEVCFTCIVVVVLVRVGENRRKISC